MISPKMPTLLFTAITIAAGAALGGGEPNAVPAFEPNSRILFQGDSITDMNRGRSADPNHILGHSYAFLIAGAVWLRLSRASPYIHQSWRQW